LDKPFLFQNFYASSLMTFKILFYIIFMTLSTANQVTSASEKKLPPCRDSPNCVSSQAEDAKHFIEPFKISGSPQEAWKTLKDAINNQSRMAITHETSDTLHAEATSLVFGFVDDINVILDVDTNLIHIRSASRKGHSDFGVNRKRIEALRLQLQKEHVIN
jgi:uncharacterized protein (DUF1499 family)